MSGTVSILSHFNGLGFFYCFWFGSVFVLLWDGFLFQFLILILRLCLIHFFFFFKFQYKVTTAIMFCQNLYWGNCLMLSDSLCNTVKCIILMGIKWWCWSLHMSLYITLVCHTVANFFPFFNFWFMFCIYFLFYFCYTWARKLCP